MSHELNQRSSERVFKREETNHKNHQIQRAVESAREDVNGETEAERREGLRREIGAHG